MAFEGPHVAVVGAGLAGLAASHFLRLGGAHPVLLEADWVTGGRVKVLTSPVDGEPLELGGEVRAPHNLISLCVGLSPHQSSIAPAVLPQQ